MAYTLRNPYTLPGGNSISGGPGQSDDPNNSLNLGLGAIYKSDLMQGTDANFITQNTGMDLNQWQESQNGINQKGGWLSDIVSAIFGTWMVIPNAIEGWVANIGESIRNVASDISQGKSVGTIISDWYNESQAASTVWSYVKAGYDMSANNGFRMLEDVTGQYTAMDKFSNTAKFFLGLGVDIAAFIPGGEISAAAGLGKKVINATFNAADAVEKDVNAPLFQRTLARNIADVTGGWERATASLNPLINKTANFIWGYKSAKAKLFQYGKGLTQQTLAKMRLNSGLTSQAKNVANKLEETNAKYKRQFVDRALSDMSNEDDKSILETIFNNTDKYYTENNKKFTPLEKSALRNGTTQKLPRAERQIIKAKLSMGFDTQASAEIEKKLPYTGTYENTIIPLADTIGVDNGIHKIVVNTDEAAEARKLADPLKVWDQHTSVGELDKTLPVKTVDITKSGLKEGKEAIINLQKDTGPMAAAREAAKDRLGKSEEVVGKLSGLNDKINTFKKKIGSIEEAKDIKNADLDKLSTDLLRIREIDPKLMKKILDKDYEVGDETFEKALALVRKYGLKESSEGLATNKVTKDFFSEELDSKIKNISDDLDEIIQHAEERRVFEHDVTVINKTKYGKQIATLYRNNDEIMKTLTTKIQPKQLELQKENEVLQKELTDAKADLDSKTFEYNTKKMEYEKVLTEDTEMFSKIQKEKGITTKPEKTEDIEKKRALYNTYKEWQANEKEFAKIQKAHDEKVAPLKKNIAKNERALSEIKFKSDSFMAKYNATKKAIEDSIKVKEVKPVVVKTKAKDLEKQQKKAHDEFVKKSKVEIKSVKDEIEGHKKEIHQYQKHVDKLRKEIDVAKNNLDEYREDHYLSDHMYRQVIHDAERFIESATPEEIATNRSLTERKKVYDLHHAYFDRKAEMAGYNKAIIEKSVIVKGLRDTLDKKEKALSEKVAAFKKPIKLSEQEIKSVKDEIAAHQNDIAKSQEQLEKSKEIHEKLKQNIEMVKENNELNDAQYIRVMAKSKQYLEGKTPAEIKKDKNAKAVQKIVANHDLFIKKSEEIKSLTNEIETKTAAIKDLNARLEASGAPTEEVIKKTEEQEAEERIARQEAAKQEAIKVNAKWQENERKLAYFTKIHDEKTAVLKNANAKLQEDLNKTETEFNNSKAQYTAKKEEAEKVLPKDPKDLAKIMTYSKILSTTSAKDLEKDPLFQAKRKLLETYNNWKLNESTFKQLSINGKNRIDSVKQKFDKNANNLKNLAKRHEKLEEQYFDNNEKQYQLKMKSIKDTVAKHEYYESLNKDLDKKIQDITVKISEGDAKKVEINKKFDLEKDAVAKSKTLSASQIVTKINRIEIRRNEALRKVDKDTEKLFEKRAITQKLIEKNAVRSEKFLMKPNVKRELAIGKMTKKLSRPMLSVKRFGDMEDFQKEMEYAVANKFLKNESQRELQLPKRDLQYVKPGTWMDRYTGNSQRATNAMFAHAGDALGLDTKPYQSMSYMKHTLTDPGRAIVTTRVGSRYVESAIYHGQKAVMSADRKMYGSMVEKEIALGLNKADAKKLINAGFDMNAENSLKRAMQIQDSQLKISNILKSGIENGDIAFITNGSEIDNLLKNDAKGMALFNKKVISWNEFENMYHASTAIFSQEDKMAFDKVLSDTKPQISDLKKGVAIDNHLYELAHQIMNPKELNKLFLSFQKVVGKWKFLSVLSINFFIRITVGNFLNAMANTPGWNLASLLKEWFKSIMHMHRYNKFIAKMGDNGVQELMAKHIHDNDIDLFNDILKKHATPKQIESINLITQAYKHNLINFGGQMRTTSLEDIYSLSIQNGMRNQLFAKTMKVINSVHTLTSFIDDGFKIAQWQRLMKNPKLMQGFANGKIYEKDYTDFMDKNKHLMDMGKEELFAKRYADWKEFIAAKITKFSNFDYSEVTQFEQKVIRNICPFWTWFSKNLSLQLKLLKRPGYANIVHDIMISPFTTQVSPYMTSSELNANYLPIKVGNNMVLIKMSFPAEDVISVFHPDILNRLNPMVGFAYCAATGRDLSTDYNTEPWNALMPTAARNLLNRALYHLYVHDMISQTTAEKYFNDNPKAWIQNNSIFKVDNAQENFAQNVKKYIMQAAQNLTESQRFLLMHQRMLIKNMMTNPTKTKKFYIPK